MAFKSRRLKELQDQIALGEKSQRKQFVDGLMRVERLMRELRVLNRRSSKMRTAVKRATRHLDRDLHVAKQLASTMEGIETEIVQAERAKDKDRVRELNKRVKRRDRDAALRLTYLARRTKALSDMDKEMAEIAKALKKLT